MFKEMPLISPCLNPTALISVSLAGTLDELPLLGERKPSALCLDLEGQVTEIFYANREDSGLIKRHFYFRTVGASLYSRNVAKAIGAMRVGGSVTSFSDRPGDIVLPFVKNFTNLFVGRSDFSAEDYRRFTDLGKRIRVERTIYL